MPKAKGVAMMGSVGNVRILVRNYYSTHHLWSANFFADQAAEIEQTRSGKTNYFLEHRAFATNSILAVVAFLEAAINELYQDVADSHDTYIRGLSAAHKGALSAFWELAEDRRLPTLDKYQLALALTGHKRFAKGASPFQDVQLVIGMRNEVVHFKPQSVEPTAASTAARRYRGRFPLNPLAEGKGVPFFPDECLGGGCGHWAVQVCKHFADEFFRTLGLQPNYQAMKL